MDLRRITEITSGFGDARVLILGDIMLDEYMYGSVDRISPEAPVPVVNISSSKILLGGAANVAANICSLGGEALLLGTVGDDEAAIKISQLLKSEKISDDLLVTDLTRRTTIKTRIIAHSQQIVRADREDRHEVNPDIEKEIFSRFMSVVDDIQAVIVSDYGKGVINQSLLEKLMSVCLQKNIFVAVDPKETHFNNYQRVSLITPNHHEAGFAYGRRIHNEKDLLEVGKGLLKRLQAKSILITRGPDGMSLFTEDSEPTHIPTFAKKVYDVTGAGDTVIAVFVAATCAGADLVESAIVANAGAGLTVGEIGTATVTTDDLRQELEHNIKEGNLFPETETAK
ncbi:MAG: D-glycero-beta-D-manno-heptose-7-phosphate kinase [candidate division Zixibacteria bacterium]|nr:D-glycero-beta-D-manno-heptose-7-phosphate kinase [candidate division Zixibacteria bacterium]